MLIITLNTILIERDDLLIREVHALELRSWSCDRELVLDWGIIHVLLLVTGGAVDTHSISVCLGYVAHHGEGWKWLKPKPSNALINARKVFARVFNHALEGA